MTDLRLKAQLKYKIYFVKVISCSPVKTFVFVAMVFNFLFVSVVNAGSSSAAVYGLQKMRLSSKNIGY